MYERVKEIISEMCIAEIQKTFGVSKMTAMQMKRGNLKHVDFEKFISFLAKQRLVG